MVRAAAAILSALLILGIITVAYVTSSITSSMPLEKLSNARLFCLVCRS
jgi:hypothetical protein